VTNPAQVEQVSQVIRGIREIQAEQVKLAEQMRYLTTSLIIGKDLYPCMKLWLPEKISRYLLP
jgi:hypothetical protein